MSCWALIAVKSNRSGKSRLASALSADERAHLVTRMLEHVLEAAQACDALDEVAVMSPGGCAYAPGAVSLSDAGSDLNGSLLHAIGTLTARNAERVVVLPADLPLLRSTEITKLIDASRASGLAIAPDHHERGTNALCLALPSRFEPQFGPDSFSRHLAQAARLGLKPAIVRSFGLAFDVDEPSDVALWPNHEFSLARPVPTSEPCVVKESGNV